MLRNTPSDASHAIRMMIALPGFTAVVVLTLAVGIGTTTAMFGVIQAAFFSHLSFEEPDRLVMGRATFDGEVNPWVSGYDYYDYRDQSRSFESLSAFFFAGRSTVLGATEPERVVTAFATWDLFETLGVKPVAGRSFVAEEGVEGRATVVVISYRYWQQRFGGAPQAIGGTLIINGSPFTVVGVLPKDFYFMEHVDIWRLTYRDGPGAEARRWHNLLLAGRLRPGATIEKAQAEADVISRNLQEQYPGTNEGKALLVTPLHDALIENVRTSLLLLMAAVSLVLLLACGNVAGLLLARGQMRLTEIAIRSALGASRTRLVRQLLTESLLLAAVAGAVGVALAVGFQSLLARLLPMGQLGITRPSLDAPLLVFVISVSLVTGILFGLVPALQGTIVNLSRQLKSGARTTWTRGHAFIRRGLVVGQVAVSVVLLIGASLLIQSLSRQMNVDLGFDPTNVLTATVTLPENGYPNPDQRIAFLDSLVEEVEGLPGVTSVGMINRLPIRHPSGNIYLYPPGQVPEESQGDMSRSADFRYALPGYLRTIGIPLLAGRDIARTDVDTSPRVMLITESLAESFFEGKNPLGQRLIVDMGDEMVSHEIVGIVGNARLSRVRSQPFHAMYMSYYQVPGNTMRIAVKTEKEASALTQSLRDVLRTKDPNIPLAEPATMTAILEDAMSDYRVVTSTLGLFSSLALLLAMVGLYGVLAYYVSQRQHEIGVRMALGAAPRQVARSILSHGMGLVILGLGIGLAGSSWASRLIQQLLFGVEPTDWVTYLFVALLSASVALMACLLPAWRAMRVDPAATLQST